MAGKALFAPNKLTYSRLATRCSGDGEALLRGGMMIDFKHSEYDQLRRNVAGFNLFYAIFLMAVLVGGAVVSTIILGLSRETIIALVVTYLRPLMLQAVGLRGNEMVEWLLTLLRFSPLIFGLVSIGTSLVTGFITTFPFFATSYGLYKGKNWTHIPATIAVMMAFPFVPVGTFLSVYTAYGFYKLNQATETRAYYS
jgi:hypothetical protein